MESQKGIYALLLGSGVSRSAAVPTGWEITIDLAERVAREAGEHCAGEEAISWVHQAVRSGTRLFASTPYDGWLDRDQPVVDLLRISIAAYQATRAYTSPPLCACRHFRQSSASQDGVSDFFPCRALVTS